LWNDSQGQLAQKHLQQIIAFAGEGKLLDGTAASTEFRELLRAIPLGEIKRDVDDCLGGFNDGGLALQDAVNEVGSRLGFTSHRGDAGEHRRRLVLMAFGVLVMGARSSLKSRRPIPIGSILKPWHRTGAG